MKNREYNYLFKMVLVGNSSVGKSSILLRFADGEFNDMFISTIGVDFRFKNLEFEDKKVKLQIWDTAGQERFRTITSSYYKGSNYQYAGAHAIIITYDITNKQSFDDVSSYWYNQIKTHCQNDTVVMLIGNKSDLDSQRQVTKQQVQLWTNSHNIQYIQTSAKESHNVQAAFIKISKSLIKLHEIKQQELQKTKNKKNRKKQQSKDNTNPQSNSRQQGPQKLISQKPTNKPKGCCPY